MAKLRKFDKLWVFFCLGCKCDHFIDGRWEWNGSVDSPTIRPSIRVRYPSLDGDKICHSFVTEGNIQYLEDSSHSLAGQTVEIPDYGE